ncbi:protein translocase subunit SecF [Candidatus Bipolaricaulota bacterium]|nr:protein translocase subunit SecF [Candidatus Bipolaricaulota bacterium]
MNYEFDLLGKAKYFSIGSLIAIIVGAILILTIGMNLGIDFTGGTKFEIVFNEEVSTAELRSFLTDSDQLSALSGSKLQNVQGQNEIDISTKLDVGQNAEVLDELERQLAREFDISEGNISRKSVGEKISQELQTKGWQAIGLALLVILIYISWRFRLRYAVGAVAAVIHDVVIAMAIFAIFRIEINLPTIGAFLTIVGYSLNDTIVYFDRIRENASKKIARKGSTFALINKSINQSLSRTISTSTTTFLPVIALVAFGGPVLRAFSLALLIGVIVGTYSSIYVASPIVYLWDKYLASE